MSKITIDIGNKDVKVFRDGVELFPKHESKKPANYLGKCRLCGSDVRMRQWGLESTPNCSNDSCPAAAYGYGRVNDQSSKISWWWIDES